MYITNSTQADYGAIQDLYSAARELMSRVGTVTWPQFSEQVIRTEIAENRQWKIIDEGVVAAVFATTFSDPEIWEERNADPSVYIHRIATNPALRGKGYVGKIVEWAKKHAMENGKQFVRLDTVGENHSLINVYKSHGFTFLGLKPLRDSSGLPAHYQVADVAFFEISLE